MNKYPEAECGEQGQMSNSDSVLASKEENIQGEAANSSQSTVISGKHNLFEISKSKYFP